jgi:transcriptional regulator with XRE-family HTH domain
MIFPHQLRAARALLDMSQEELAKAAGVGVMTVKRMEAARPEITGSARTVHKIQTALEEAGIVFIAADAQGGLGVRLRSPTRGAD